MGIRQAIGHMHGANIHRVETSSKSSSASEGDLSPTADASPRSPSPAAELSPMPLDKNSTLVDGVSLLAVASFLSLADLAAQTADSICRLITRALRSPAQHGSVSDVIDLAIVLSKSQYGAESKKVMDHLMRWLFVPPATACVCVCCF